MPADSSHTAGEEILSIRVPTGTKARLKAASGQPASVIVRYMITGYLNKAEQQAIPVLQQIAADGHAAGASFAPGSPIPDRD